MNSRRAAAALNLMEALVGDGLCIDAGLEPYDSDMDGVEQCPVCYSSMVEAKMLCGHGFCVSCILMRMAESADEKCMYCRQTAADVVSKRECPVAN